MCLALVSPPTSLRVGAQACLRSHPRRAADARGTTRGRGGAPGALSPAVLLQQRQEKLTQQQHFQKLEFSG